MEDFGIKKIKEKERISPVKEKKDQQLDYPTEIFLKTSSKELLIYAILIGDLNGFFKKLWKHEALLSSLSDKTHFISDMNNFKNLLELLQDNDLSHEAEFAKKLSSSWNGFINTFLYARKSEKKENFYKVGQQLIESINHYPIESDHSLGYYLSHFAGETWIPFPFMKILQSLHLEHAEKQEESHLQLWKKTLDTLIESFAKIILRSLNLSENSKKYHDFIP